jgi:hypothetical protein
MLDRGWKNPPGRPRGSSNLRLTDMEQRFVKAMAETGNATFGAWRAGYSDPVNAGQRLKHKPMVVSAVRAETQRFLLEKGAELSVKTLARLCGPDNPVNIQVKAASKLADLANIKITDQEADKQPSEFTAGELLREVNRIMLERRTIDLTALPAPPEDDDSEDYENDETGEINDVFA